MKSKVLRKELRKVADRYKPVAPYLTPDSITGFIEGYVALYKRWQKGESIKDVSLELEIMPAEEEAIELESQLTSAEAFIETFDDDMCLCIDVGVVELVQPASKVVKFDSISIKDLQTGEAK